MIGHKFQSDEQLRNNIVRNLPLDIFTPGCCRAILLGGR